MNTMATQSRRGHDCPSSSQRLLRPRAPRARASSSRSDTSGSQRSKSDSENASPTPEIPKAVYTIPAFFPLSQQSLPRTKVLDEWSKPFSKFPTMRTQVDDQKLIIVHEEERLRESRIALLMKFSCIPEEDSQLPVIEAYIKDADGHIAITIEDPVADRDGQQPRGWVDHQVWITGHEKCVTIPEQPGKILTPLGLEAALQPQQPIHVCGGHLDSYYRRLVYVGDPDPAAITALVKQASMSQAWALGVLFRGYFSTSPEFSLQVEVISIPTKVANIVYHMPYLCLGTERKCDTRVVGGQPLRTTWELSCLGVLASEAGKEASGSGLFLSEGMVSIALNVRDDRWWGVTCLKDEFLLKKAVLEDETGDGDEEDEDEDNDTTTTDRRGPPIEGSYLQHIDLEQVDPILNEGSGYTDKNPRVYMLVALDKQLEGLVQRAELLYRTFYGVIKAYNESSLPRADKPQSFAGKRSQTEIKEALDQALIFLKKILSIVKQQENEVNRHLKDDLGIDLAAKTIKFTNPRFVGLKLLSEPTAKNKVKGILGSAKKLHTLRHSIEELLLTVLDLTKSVNRKIVEDLQVAQHKYAVHGLKLGVLLYLSQALMVPLNLYNIPQTTTMLPNSPLGLAIFTIGLTSLFLLAPFSLSFFSKLWICIRVFLRP